MKLDNFKGCVFFIFVFNENFSSFIILYRFFFLFLNSICFVWFVYF